MEEIFNNICNSLEMMYYHDVYGEEDDHIRNYDIQCAELTYYDLVKIARLIQSEYGYSNDFLDETIDNL